MQQIVSHICHCFQSYSPSLPASGPHLLYANAPVLSHSGLEFVKRDTARLTLEVILVPKRLVWFGWNGSR